MGGEKEQECTEDGGMECDRRQTQYATHTSASAACTALGWLINPFTWQTFTFYYRSSGLNICICK